MRSAEGTALDGLTMRLGPGGTGLSGGPGSGGSVVNLRVEGGDVALDYTQPGEQPTVVALTAIGQSKSVMLVAGGATVMAVGVSVDGFLGQTAFDVLDTAASTRFSLVDSVVSFAAAAPDNTVVRAARPANLDEVWVRRAAHAMARKPDGETLDVTQGAPDDFRHVLRAALTMPFGVPQGTTQPPLWSSPGNAPMVSHLWEDSPACPGGKCNELIEEGAPAVVPPLAAGSTVGALGSRHGDMELAEFDRADAVLLTPSSDLADAIQENPGGLLFLTKGKYLLTDSLTLSGNVRVKGTAAAYVRLLPASSGAFVGGGPVPIIHELAGDASELHAVSLFDAPDWTDGVALPGTASYAASATASAYGILWEGGPKSVVNLVAVNFRQNVMISGPPPAVTPGCTQPFHDFRSAGRVFRVPSPMPTARIDDASACSFRLSGAGRYYGLHAQYGNRAQKPAPGINTLVEGADGLFVYGNKRESGGGGSGGDASTIANVYQLVLRNSTRVRWFGSGGNGMPGLGVAGGTGDSDWALGLYFVGPGVTDARLYNLGESFDQPLPWHFDDPHYRVVGRAGGQAAWPSAYDPATADWTERPALITIP